MIAANELRIGNFILFKQFGKGEGKVGQMKPGDFGRVKYDDPEESEYHPIPLSPEWLERCGFEKREKTEDGEYWGIFNFTLIYARHDEDGYGWFLNGYHNDCHIEYVHQLQNLYFALTGEELTLKEIA